MQRALRRLYFFKINVPEILTSTGTVAFSQTRPYKVHGIRVLCGIVKMLALFYSTKYKPNRTDNKLQNKNSRGKNIGSLIHMIESSTETRRNTVFWIQDNSTESIL